MLRDMEKVLLERNLFCHASLTKVIAIEKVQPSAW